MRQAFLASLMILCVNAHAEAPIKPSELPLWEIGVGAGGISQLAYPGADEQVNRAVAAPYPRRPPKLPHPWPPKLLHLAGVN